MKEMILGLLYLFGACDAVAFYSLVADAEWVAFKAMYNKSYSETEENFRHKVFLENKFKVVEHNNRYALGMTSYALAINEFADMLPHEFSSIMLGLSGEKRNDADRSTYLRLANANVPKSVDWRTKGYVTPVKNQGACGSCWAFSTTGSLEGQHFRKEGKLVSLSEQNLVDCSGAFGNQGCNGGLMDSAFQYIKANGGIDTEESYQYEAKDDKCRFNKSNVGATVTGYTDVTQGDEDALKEAVATVGPVSVAIDASHDTFQLYSHGIYYEPDCSSTELDHGVLVVGFGSNKKGKDFWLVKNSWGESWGAKGYIKMARNRDNNCGIATSASYPLV